MNTRVSMLCWVALSCSCGGAQSAQLVADARERLHRAMSEEVATREQRDQLSRGMLDDVEQADLEHMDLVGVQAQFGRGNACQSSALCASHGFRDDDLYYPIGVASDASIKQVPTLIFGFDQHGKVTRVFTLRTH